MDTITRKAYAKINLALAVLSRRPDGYHEIRTVMQSVGLYDELTFTKLPPEGPEPRITFRTDSPHVPADESNLAYRAAALVFARCPVEGGVAITLKKNIPVAAGLAGGSSDAAAVFHGLNELFGLQMTAEKMREMGLILGADIPYCLLGGTALAEGVGERLTPLPPLPPCHVLLVNPGRGVPTPWVYQNLQLAELPARPNIDGMMAALRRQDLAETTANMGNDLESVTALACPLIGEIKRHMRALGALNALMSGSGSTVFGLFDDEEKAVRAHNEMISHFPLSFLVDVI
ncbi:MAG: 4-(cytidine 5'-diphospho)-2-C-methyl-D-erythritol kinase [Lachnospiraceae bacterium]|jgi:4-diphosphocytidyl-2-C-methyl-D-erythritol kinase|nr:4-(cytidine 5'-diphospho)-2-C-methyl-D-erythritol kinase [Lachnospiraceae bacterium]